MNHDLPSGKHGHDAGSRSRRAHALSVSAMSMQQLLQSLNRCRMVGVLREVSPLAGIGFVVVQFPTLGSLIPLGVAIAFCAK